MINQTVEVYGLTEQHVIYAWRGRGFLSESDMQTFLRRQTELWQTRPLLYRRVPPPKIVERRA